MLRRAVFAALFGLALSASTSVAHAYCRTTTIALPANYNPANRGCFTQGLFLYWRNACVGFSINQAASRTVPYADAQRIIDTAFATWMGVTCTASGKAPGITVSDFGAAACDEVRYNPDGANQNLIVFRDDSWPYHDPNNTLGLTTVTFNADTGEIFDADMEINSSAHNLSITEQVPANGFDLASVITHEAGHFLGLAHATSSSATMFAAYKPGTTALRTLSADDIAGLCSIYPDADTRIVSQTPTQPEQLAALACDPTPRHGLTSACDVPTQTETTSKCSAGGALVPSSGRNDASAGFAVVAVGLLLVRRRRQARA
jgi:hypothetical protein